MALKAMLKNLDGLDAAAKAFYKADGDRFLLDVEAVEGFELVGAGLKTALAKERQTREELEKRVEAFKDFDPDKARDALKRVDAMKNWTPEEKVNEQLQAKLKELAAQKDAEYKPRIDGLEATRKAYESLVIDKALEDAAAKNKFISPKLAAKLFRDQVALADSKPVVMGTDGKPRKVMLNDGTERTVTIDEYVAEQAKLDDYKPLIAGNSATGTQGRNPQTQTNQPATFGGPDRLQQAKQELASLLVPRG